MTTTEDQTRFDIRMQYMAKPMLSASVTAISVEPMLGPVNIDEYQGYVDWVICGGESGPGAREMNIEWARDLRDQCAAYQIPFFMKQMGSVWMRQNGKTGKGESLGDLPEDLRIRQWPGHYTR